MGTINNKLNNVTVVIRCAGEATEQLSYSLVSKQVQTDNIFLVHETPFVRAVIKTFEIGIEQANKWTLAIDGDVLIFDNSIEELVEWAESCEDHFFEFQGRVFDKFFCSPRPGGPHLYRTKYLREALKYVPKEQENLRPESHTYKKMAEIGIHYYHDLKIYGLHDFFQFHRDIYRKCYVHAKKHNQYLEYFLTQWTTRSLKDNDYIFAIKGILDGLINKHKTRADLNYFANNKSSINFINEPAEIEPLKNLDDSIDEIMSSFKLDKPSEEFANSIMNHFERSDVKKESSEKVSPAKNKFIWRFGSTIEKLGHFIKHKS